ncbi:hypothetical protein U1Q18_048957 [Sarracenia purpurea var. burkii]
MLIFFCLLLVKDLHGWAFRNKFDELKLAQFFIDKTEFLRLLFDPTCSASSEQFYFITAPHRFSKSTLLRMTRAFAKSKSIRSSLLLLVKFMYELFDNTRVILLIDEYDNTALRSYIFQRGYTARNYRKFNRILFKLIKGGKNYLQNILMMSVSSLAFASDEILPKYMTHMCFLNDHSFMPYLGVTQTELEDIFNKYDCSPEERTAVMEYYKPYRTAVKKSPVYHPTR